MNFEKVMRMIGEWAGTLRFFPGEPEARLGIAKQIAKFASDESQVRWLVEVLPNHFGDWPGTHEVRAVFCMKFRPKDGVEVDSKVFPDGLSKAQLNPGVKQLEAPSPLQLPGEVLSADPLLVEIIREAAANSKTVNVTVNFGQLNVIQPEPEESDYHALTRQVARDKAAAKEREVQAATEAQIAFVRDLQNSQRKESSAA
jgi:hypothetical protein